MPGNPAIIVRRAEVRDAEAVARTFAAAHAFAGTLQWPFPSTSARQKRIAEMQADHYMLVANVDADVVANAGLHPVSNSPRRRHAGSIGIRACGVGTGVTHEGRVGR